jgi:amino-acid N-acetyltransferase
MSTIELRTAEPHDREYVEELLADSDLPTEDLATAYSSLFVCESEDEDERVGIGGLKLFEDVGLLRSVAVEASERGNGYGTAISDKLLDRARDNGLDAVYLLTETAEEFFADRGFERVEREQMADPIQETAEFQHLCADHAACMKLDLQ